MICFVQFNSFGTKNMRMHKYFLIKPISQYLRIACSLLDK